MDIVRADFQKQTYICQLRARDRVADGYEWIQIRIQILWIPRTEQLLNITATLAE